MRPKRYCLLVLLLALAGLAAIAGFNLLIDPLGAYGSVSLRCFEPLRHTLFTRTSRAELGRRGPWDMIVLGTSRPKAGLAAHDPAFATGRVCNLAMDGARVSEAAAILDFVGARQPLHRAVLFLDMVMFCSTNLYRHDFDHSRINPHLSLFQYHCRNLIGADMTGISWQFASKSLRHSWPPEGETNGFYVHSIRAKTPQRDLFERVLTSHAAAYASMRVAPVQMDELRRVLRLCRAADLDLVLAINPVHALDLELLRAGGKWEEFEQWKRDLVTLADAPAAAVPLWDFSGYNSFTCENVPPSGSHQRMKFYFENSHYTPALGAVMLERILLGASNDFGIRLSRNKIERHLQSVREDRERYAETHAADVRWVQIISDRARAERNPGDDEDIE